MKTKIMILCLLMISMTLGGCQYFGDDFSGNSKVILTDLKIGYNETKIVVENKAEAGFWKGEIFYKQEVIKFLPSRNIKNKDITTFDNLKHSYTIVIYSKQNDAWTKTDEINVMPNGM